MKIVYIAHPLASNPQKNYEVAKKLCRDISLMYPDIVPVCPLLVFKFLREPEDREIALKYCLKLLQRCDELWLAGNWQKSEGCLLEKALAKKVGIPVKDKEKLLIKPKMQDCTNCKKAIKKKRHPKCSVLLDNKYPFDHYGSCWAYTDDPRWEEKVEKSIQEYRAYQGVGVA